MYHHSSVYKLCCRDPSITDCYVGSTCNVRTRRDAHRRQCIYPSQKDHNLRLYQFIRAHGGWDNWTMVVLEEFSCETKTQRDTREHEWKLRLGEAASLNSRDAAAYARAGGVAAYKKQHFEKHKAKYQEANKQRYEENKEAISARHKEWYELNKARISAKGRERITCEMCGASVCRAYLKKHKKRPKCLAAQNPPPKSMNTD